MTEDIDRWIAEVEERLKDGYWKREPDHEKAVGVVSYDLKVAISLLKEYREREKNVCVWRENHYKLWMAGCSTVITKSADITPTEHGYKFCPCCGYRLQEESYKEGK